jgi:predicted transcriptional regulator
MSSKSLSDVRFAKAKDVMTKGYVSIDGSATVAEAVKLMRKENVPCLIVNRRTPEDAWGIITKKDVVTKVVDPGKHSNQVYVYEIMSKPMITVAPGLALKYCARLFKMTGVRRAPVFDGKAIVGTLSLGDIFDAIDDESLLIANLIDPADELLPVSDPAPEPEPESEQEELPMSAEIDGFRPDSI